jgi:hypothetical protein
MKKNSCRSFFVNLKYKNKIAYLCFTKIISKTFYSIVKGMVKILWKIYRGFIEELTEALRRHIDKYNKGGNGLKIRQKM